MQTVYLVP